MNKKNKLFPPFQIWIFIFGGVFLGLSHGWEVWVDSIGGSFKGIHVNKEGKAFVGVDRTITIYQDQKEPIALTFPGTEHLYITEISSSGDSILIVKGGVVYFSEGPGSDWQLLDPNFKVGHYGYFNPIEVNNGEIWAGYVNTDPRSDGPGNSYLMTKGVSGWEIIGTGQGENFQEFKSPNYIKSVFVTDSSVLAGSGSYVFRFLPAEKKMDTLLPIVAGEAEVEFDALSRFSMISIVEIDSSILASRINLYNSSYNSMTLLSRDLGRSWDSIGAFSSLAIDDNRILSLTTKGDLFQSMDAGNSWTSLIGPVLDPEKEMVFYEIFVSENHVFVFGRDDEFQLLRIAKKDLYEQTDRVIVLENGKSQPFEWQSGIDLMGRRSLDHFLQLYK